MGRGRGAVAGILAAALGLGVGELVAGLARSAAAPVVPVGQVVIDHVPISVKEWAIRTFGSSTRPCSSSARWSSIIVIGALAGMLAGSGHLFWPRSSVTAVIGFVGCWAVAVRPAPSLVKMLPAILGTLAAGAALWLLTEGLERWTEPLQRPTCSPGPWRGRRGGRPGDRRRRHLPDRDHRRLATAAGRRCSSDAHRASTGGVPRRRCRDRGRRGDHRQSRCGRCASGSSVTSERAQLTLPAPVSAASAIGFKDQVGVPGVDPS